MNTEDKWFGDLLPAFGVKSGDALAPVAENIVRWTAPGALINTDILNYANGHLERDDPFSKPFTAQDLHEVGCLLALGIQKAVKKQSPTPVMENLRVILAFGDPPEARPISFYSRDEDALVVTKEEFYQYMAAIRHNRKAAVDPDVTPTQVKLGNGAVLSPEEFIIYNGFQHAFAAGQLKKAENLSCASNDPALAYEREQEKIGFINEMQDGKYAGRFIAATDHILCDVNLGLERKEEKYQG